jgi:hypothetical protein
LPTTTSAGRRREVSGALGRRHVDAGKAQRHVGEHGAIEPLVQARHRFVGGLALAHDLGGAAAGARHAFDEVAIHRRADAEAEHARLPAHGADVVDDLLLVADEAVGAEDDHAQARCCALYFESDAGASGKQGGAFSDSA